MADALLLARASIIKAYGKPVFIHISTPCRQAGRSQ
jgi:hypothetical protein